MEIYELKKRKDLQFNDNPWEPWYDKAFGFTVIAENEYEARKLAASESGDEGTEAWLNEKYSTCEIVSTSSGARIITKDFASA